MRVQWATPVFLVILLALAGLPATACIPGAPDQAFEPQALGMGGVFLDVSNVSKTTTDELFPQVATFRDSLYITYQRENFTDTVKYYVTLRSYDGTSWADELFLSCPDITTPVRSELNLNPRLGASEDALYCVWTSNEPNWTYGADDDVVFRYSMDGATWSEVIEVTGHYNYGLDKLARVVPLKDRVWFIWETNDPLDSDGKDMDIVMRSWDGHDLGQVVEVTPPGDVYNDHHVVAAADGEHMYIMWMKKNYTSGMANVHDIWARVFDGHEWTTPPTKISSDALADNEHPDVVAADGRGVFLWETYDTGKVADQSSIVMCTWKPGEGFGPRTFVSSLVSNGKDSKPASLWWNDMLYVAWISADQGVTFGEDTDLVFRTLEFSDGDRVDLDDIVEVSHHRDDYGDRSPKLAVLDDVVQAVWTLDNNYSHLVNESFLKELGGVYRNPDVVIQSIDYPFEKSLKLVYTLGSAVPMATKPTMAKVTVTDLRDEPIEDLRVMLRYCTESGPPHKAQLQLLEDRGEGVYAVEELAFANDGTYTVAIVVNDVEVGDFVVDVDPPPPSFLDRFPWATVFFIAAGATIGLLLYRAMGRDDLVSELRPAPLETAAAEG